jgi:hypothetical protein
MKKYTRKFYSSIFLGISIWFFFYFVTPIEAKNCISFSTLSFIIASYIFLIVGFHFSPNLIKKNKVLQCNTQLNRHSVLILKSIIVIISLSFIIRYIDLFYFRGLSFSNYGLLNKRIASNPDNYSFIFGMFSIFRVIYFVPLIFYYGLKIDSKKLLIFSFLLFLMPLTEGYLRDSRRIFFESFLLLILILFFYKKDYFLSLRSYFFFFIITTSLLIYSFFVIQGRMQVKPDNFYERIYKSEYYNFVPIKKQTVKFLDQNKNNFLAKIYFSEIHIGQYITHSVFEMDYMKSRLKTHTYGKFNGYLFIKFLNKLRITNIDLNNLNNPTKRNTYITLFGGMFIDFGWFSLPLMFLFGCFQKQVFVSEEYTVFLRPLMALLFFSNIFLLIMNFIRAQFLLTFGVYLILTMFIWIFFRLNKNNNLISNY